MRQNSTNTRFSPPGASERGMTLLELLVAVCVSGILITIAFQFLSVSAEGMLSGREHAEMQQELRWATQFVSEHVALAGNTVPQLLLDDKGHQIITNFNGAGDEPDSLGIVGSFRSVVLTLDQTMGNEDSPIKCSDKTSVPAIPLDELLAIKDLGVISDGTFSEVFQITDISGDQVLHDTSLPWNDSKQLEHRYAIGSTFSMVANYSFFVATDEKGRPNLMVRTQAYPPQILAGDVEQFQVRFLMKSGQWQDTVDASEITMNEVSQVEIYMRARSPQPIRGYRDPVYGDAYKRMELRTMVIPRNISVI